jgi:hypothetical protein
MTALTLKLLFIVFGAVFCAIIVVVLGRFFENRRNNRLEFYRDYLDSVGEKNVSKKYIAELERHFWPFTSQEEHDLIKRLKGHQNDNS